MRTMLLLAVTISAFGFAPVPPPRPNKLPDLAALAGSWQMIRYQSGNDDRLVGREMRVTIDKDQWTFHVSENGQAERATTQYLMTLDTTVKPPLFRWHAKDGKTTQYLGSLQVERNTLSLVFTASRPNAENDRPTDFKNLGGKDFLIVLKRQSAVP